MLVINEQKFRFPLSPNENLDKQPWFDQARKHGIPSEHASLLSLAIKNMKSKPESLDAAIETSFNMVSDPVISEELYRKREQLREIEVKLLKIKETTSSVRAKQQRKTNKFYYSITGMCTIQLGLGYHCIENVEWLGWDLVEPLTYTLGQGTFIWGMLYMLYYRRMHDGNYSDLKEDYIDRRIQ